MNNLHQTIWNAYTPIVITQYALDKSNYIANRVCELAEKQVEILFYLLDDSLVGREPNIVARDVFINYNQDLEYVHCATRGAGGVQTNRDIKRMNKRIVLWGHTHADFEVFYSDEDKRTIRSLVQQYGIKKKKVSFEMQDIGKPSHKLEVPFFWGLTFNTQGVLPHAVLSYIWNNETYIEEQDVPLAVIDDNQQITPQDKNEIDRHLLERVIQLREKYTSLDEEISQLNSSFSLTYKKIKEAFRTPLTEIVEQGKSGREELFSSSRCNNKHSLTLLELVQSIQDLSHISSHYESLIRSLDLPQQQRIHTNYKLTTRLIEHIHSRLRSNKSYFEKRIEKLVQEQDSPLSLRKILQRKTSSESLIEQYTFLTKV